MLKRRFAALVVAVGIFLAGATPTYAQIAFFSNGTGITSPAQTITFNEVAVATNAPVTNQFASFGANFDNAIMNPQDGYFAKNYLGNFGPGVANPDLSITFTSARTGAAFQYISNPGTSTFNAYLGNQLVATGSVFTDTTVGPYYGFTGGAFDRIQLIAPGGGAMLIDNVQIGAAAAPEPATWAFMILGFGIVGAALRRRQMTGSAAPLATA